MPLLVSSGAPLVTFVSAQAVTPNDGADLPSGVTHGFMIGGAGALKVDTKYDTGIILTGLVVGTFYPLELKRVYATGTAATNIVALY